MYSGNRTFRGHLATAVVLVLCMSMGSASYGRDAGPVMDLEGSASRIVVSWMKVMSDPGLFRLLMQLNDPEIYNQWVGMATSPRLVDAMVGMEDSGVLRQWLELMTDAALVEGMMRWAEPEVMSRWVDAMTNPSTMEAMTTTMTPEFVQSILDSVNRLVEGFEGAGDTTGY